MPQVDNNIFVWVPQIVASTNDAKYTITISNTLIEGQAKSYTYEVTASTP